MSAQKRQDSSSSTSSDEENTLEFEDTETVTDASQGVTLEVYANQTGGHSQIFTVENNTKIVKPMNPHERHVYELIQQGSNMKPFTAGFHGVLKHNDSSFGSVNREFQNAGEWIMLENLTAKYKQPCILDIKLGHRAFVEAGNKRKSLKYEVKYASTTAVSLGFRISGIRVYRPAFDNYLIRKSVHANRLLSDVDGTLVDSLASYLHNGVEVRTDLIPTFVKKLESLRQNLLAQSDFDFVASSVLLMYEGSPSLSEAEQDPVAAAKIDVRIIDFDHTTTDTHPLHIKIMAENPDHFEHTHRKDTEPVPLHGLINEDANDRNGVARGVGSLTTLLKRVLMNAPKQKSVGIIKPSLLKQEHDDVEPKHLSAHSDPARQHPKKGHANLNDDIALVQVNQ